MKTDYVGGFGVQCGCIFCRNCLLLNEILYFGHSVITKEEAVSKKYKCVSCNEDLVDTTKMNEGDKHIVM